MSLSIITILLLAVGRSAIAVESKNGMRVHFADTVRSLEQLSVDTKAMFERAEKSLRQIDEEPQPYFLDFIIESIARAITQCNNAPFYPDVCKLEPEVRRLQYILRDKVNYGQRRQALCKQMGTLSIEIQNNLKYISDLFVKVTNEAYEMIHILEMMEYDQYNPKWKEHMAQAKDDLIERTAKMKRMEMAIRGVIATVEIAIIAIVPPNPVTIILEVISIGIALAESISQQKNYRDQLKHAKNELNKAIIDVNKVNGRIDDECKSLESSWNKLIDNGIATLDNVNGVTQRLREVLPKLYGGIDNGNLAFSSNRQFSTNNAALIDGQTDNIRTFMVGELYPRINNALEDLFGKFSVEELPDMIWITNEVVTKVKINSTIETIVSEITPKGKHFSNLQIMHLVGQMFPGRSCYQYYPLEPARRKQDHPTYYVQDINKVADTLQTTLFYNALKPDCSNIKEIVDAGKRIECNCIRHCDCVEKQDERVYRYIVACLRPDILCAQKDLQANVCSGRT